MESNLSASGKLGMQGRADACGALPSSGAVLTQTHADLLCTGCARCTALLHDRAHDPVQPCTHHHSLSVLHCFQDCVLCAHALIPVGDLPAFAGISLCHCVEQGRQAVYVASGTQVSSVGLPTIFRVLARISVWLYPIAYRPPLQALGRQMHAGVGVCRVCSNMH